MSDTITISMLELLSSKICHDLINPIGAVNNGIEFMEDMGPDAGPEARELIAYSALTSHGKTASIPLRVWRWRRRRKHQACRYRESNRKHRQPRQENQTGLEPGR